MKELDVDDFLGHLKFEKEDYNILEYCSGGCKAYALKVQYF